MTNNINQKLTVLYFPKTITVFVVVLRKMSIGVPIKVLHEAEGHIVTCETNTGEVYRGKLIEAEDNMNCQVITCVSNFKVDFMPNMNYNFI